MWVWNTILKERGMGYCFGGCCCSVTKSCLTLCNLMGCSTPGFPVLHYLLEFAQTHFHWVGDAVQLSYPWLAPSPPSLNLYQHQALFNESALYIRWPKYWSLSFSISSSKEYSGLISLKTDWFDLLGGILLGKTLSSWFSSICLTLTSLVEYNLYPKIFSL